jgi:hypothetical protein
MGRLDLDIRRAPVGDVLVIENLERFDWHLVDFVRKTTDAGLRRQLVETAYAIVLRRKFDKYSLHGVTLLCRSVSAHR